MLPSRYLMFPVAVLILILRYVGNMRVVNNFISR